MGVTQDGGDRTGTGQATLAEGVGTPGTATKPRDDRAPHQGLTDWQVGELEKDLQPDEVRYLDDAHEQPYIPTCHTIHELNRIFGFGGWESETVLVEQAGQWPYYKEGYQGDKAKSKRGLLITYRALVRLTIHTEDGPRVLMGSGVGSQVAWRKLLDDPETADPTGAHTTALKGAESDALKRAARCLGDRFGLNLSNKDARPGGNGNGAAASAAQGGGRASAAAPPAGEQKDRTEGLNLETFPGLLNAMIKLGHKGKAAVESFAAGIGYGEVKLEELGPEDWHDIYGAALREHDAG